MVKFNIGDLVCYKHDDSVEGIIEISESNETYLVRFNIGESAWTEAKLLKLAIPKPISESSGGPVDYYKLPKESTELMDLIEYKEMNCSISNIFKAAYRYGQKHHSSQKRDLEKIIYFATRELNRISKET